MRYTHVDLAELCKEINEEITLAGGTEHLLVWANGRTTSIYSKEIGSNEKIPLLEDVPRDEGYRYLEGFMTCLINKEIVKK